MIDLGQIGAGISTKLVIPDQNRFVMTVSVCLSVRKEIFDFYWEKLSMKPGFLAQMQITNVFAKTSKIKKNHFLQVVYRREESSTLPIDYIRFYVDRCKRRTYDTFKCLLEEEYKMSLQLPEPPQEVHIDL